MKICQFWRDPSAIVRISFKKFSDLVLSILPSIIYTVIMLHFYQALMPLLALLFYQRERAFLCEYQMPQKTLHIKTLHYCSASSYWVGDFRGQGDKALRLISASHILVWYKQTVFQRRSPPWFAYRKAGGDLRVVASSFHLLLDSSPSCNSHQHELT